MSDPSPGLRPALPVIQVWQEPNQLWRWRYLEPSSDGQPLAFRSNKEYESREAALRSATTAYPDVLVLEPARAGHARRASPATGCCWWPWSPWSCWCSGPAGDPPPAAPHLSPTDRVNRVEEGAPTMIDRRTESPRVHRRLGCLSPVVRLGASLRSLPASNSAGGRWPMGSRSRRWLNQSSWFSVEVGHTPPKVLVGRWTIGRIRMPW
jgi:hypothetical protein